MSSSADTDSAMRDAQAVTGAAAPRDVAVRVSGLGKTYRMYSKPSDRLVEGLLPGAVRHTAFHALRDVSFSVGRGETLGIVGRNGSGKSTLLQLICGTLKPTAGSVEVNGRVAALLELGAGFNSEFTGRENVHLNAAILGMSRAETAARLPSILEFAELGRFIDQPVKTYSSGMFVRLAFATAISSDPDVLIVDEALAVGDEAFQRKCFARIEQLQSRGSTILFVSHAPGSVLQLCTKALLLDGGELLLQGSPKTVIGQYQRLVNARGEAAAETRAAIAGAGTGAGAAPEESEDQARTGETRSSFDPGLVSRSVVEYASEGAAIRDMSIRDADGNRVNVLRMNDSYTAEYTVEFDGNAERVGFGMLFKTVGGTEVAGATTSRARHRQLDRVVPGEVRRVVFPFRCGLVPGTYFMNAGVTRDVDGEMVFMHRILDGIVFRVQLEPDVYATGLVNLLSGEPEVQPGRPSAAD